MKQKKQDTAGQPATAQKDSAAVENGSAILQVRISQVMKAELKARADRYGLGMSEYLRALLLADVLQHRGKNEGSAGGDGKSVGQGQE